MSIERAQERPAVLRALRGATTAEANEAGAIVEATAELLQEMLRRNEVVPDDVVSMIFTSTSDLDAEFPASAARKIGMAHVPLLCAREIEVPGAIARCVRVLMHLHTSREPGALKHVYLGAASQLRTDLPD
jgi:chorismate mutase